MDNFDIGVVGNWETGVLGGVGEGINLWAHGNTLISQYQKFPRANFGEKNEELSTYEISTDLLYSMRTTKVDMLMPPGAIWVRPRPSLELPVS